MNTTARPVWLFNSADVFAGNPKWLFLHVAKHRPDIDPVWISTSRQTTEFVRRLGFKAATFDSYTGRQLQERASVYVVDQVKAHLPEPLRKATLLNLWHGVGVKAVERAPGVAAADWRIAEKYIRNNQVFRNNQLFLVTSPLMEEHFRDQLGLGDDDLVRGGYPQNVYRQVHAPFRSFDHDLTGRRGLPASTRVALYAPTWRRGPAAGFLHHALPDVPRLLEVLEQEDLLLVVKMHPKLVTDPVFLKMKQRYGAEPRLQFWDPAEDVYEVLPTIDIGVVDYSSIHYDMLAAGVRRFIRYAFDLEAFEDNVRPGLSYEDLSCGTMATSFDELLAALRDPKAADDATVERLLDTFWAYSTPDSLDGLVDRALTFEHRDVPLKTLYSFDVFDTVIHRRGVEPVSVFHYVAQRMAQSDLDFPEALVRRFATIRGEAEISARNYYRRQEARAQSGDLEIGFDDIYDRLAHLYGLSAGQVEALKGWEIQGEIESSIPDRKNVAEVKKLVARGETVVLISDMYLPNAVLKRILAAADPVLAELPLYLSNDHGVQKTTKRLYLT
ncbi:MAG TPA: CDP-glycerol glycerophosphotransferase family protein, partial [Amnibacterium sp.]|nr:CDP-glycerol glycerophosphotransferase family protein [Amnibacterium sp.]